MTARPYYRQCTLQRGDSYKVAWIPESFAVVSKVLRLSNDDGWRVISIGFMRFSHEHVMARRDDYRYQRRVSDV